MRVHEAQATTVHRCRAIGRLRTALQPPNEILPLKLRSAAQAKRAQALHDAASAICSYIAAMESAAQAFAPSANEAPLLAGLLANTPESSCDASVLVHMIPGEDIRQLATVTFSFAFSACWHHGNLSTPGVHRRCHGDVAL